MAKPKKALPDEGYTLVTCFVNNSGDARKMSKELKEAISSTVAAFRDKGEEGCLLRSVSFANKKAGPAPKRARCKKKAS
ncbi:MAG: hypothetical protein AAB421_02360 [Patescibacteria group bacterium]